MSQLGKHGHGGRNGKSPKLRHRLKREAEQSSRKPPESQCKHASVSELLKR